MELDADTPQTIAVGEYVLVTREWLRGLQQSMSEIQAQFDALVELIREKCNDGN